MFSGLLVLLYPLIKIFLFCLMLHMVEYKYVRFFKIWIKRMKKKIIFLNKKFIYGYTIYCVCEDKDLCEFYTRVYDENGNYLFSTKDIDDYAKFYQLDWSKDEIQAGFKKSWVLVKDRQEHISDLWSFVEENTTVDHNLKIWLNLDAWDILPIEGLFDCWLKDDFLPIWNKMKNNEIDTFEKVNEFLVESVERLNTQMERNPGFIQLVG